MAHGHIIFKFEIVYLCCFMRVYSLLFVFVADKWSASGREVVGKWSGSGREVAGKWLGRCPKFQIRILKMSATDVTSSRDKLFKFRLVINSRSNIDPIIGDRFKIQYRSHNW